MKVELHLHTNRYSSCAVAAPEELMPRLIEQGYGAVFITEHDTLWGDWELADLQAAYPDVRIFSGVEVSLGLDRSQHMLVLGTTDRTYLRYPEASEIVAEARAQGCLTVLAHPFRWPTSPVIRRGPGLPDVLEFRTCNHDEDMARRSGLVSKRLKLPLVNAGDVHAPGMIGRYWIETYDPLETAADLRRIILSGRYENCMLEERQPVSETAPAK